MEKTKSKFPERVYYSPDKLIDNIDKLIAGKNTFRKIIAKMLQDKLS